MGAGQTHESQVYKGRPSGNKWILIVFNVITSMQLGLYTEGSKTMFLPPVMVLMSLRSIMHNVFATISSEQTSDVSETPTDSIIRE
jgi:hypothetical protein